MNPSDGLKRLLYSRLNHYLHLFEQTITTESDQFAELAHHHGITSFPRNLTSIHVIECIGNHEPINNKSIAEKLNMSKAGITKISTKLLQEGFIRRSQMNDNKKEVYFSLSPKGRQIFELHAILHESLEHKFIDAIDAFTEPELQASLKFIQTMIDHLGNLANESEEEARTRSDR